MKFFKLSFEQSFGAVIFRKDGVGEIKFLLLRYRRGHWDFPRGHKENHETDEETVRREVQEETGLVDIEIVPSFLATGWFWYIAKGDELEARLKNKQGTVILKKTYIHLAQVRTDQIKLLSPKEQSGFAWLSFEEAIGRVTYARPRKTLEKAHRFLLKLTR